jgi:carboxypeptidase C (cathepsin A)
MTTRTVLLVLCALWWEGGAFAANVLAFPADKTVRARATIAGHVIEYDATVGSIRARADDGADIGDVVFIAYVVPGQSGHRPITFAFNGGPGSPAALVNLGALGPKRVQFGAPGDAPSDPPVATDNANSWLEFTDLVFIDPVGTGYSRSRLDAPATAKAFYGTKTDVRYLSDVVNNWLVAHGRLTSPKYLVGESYGGFRVPRMAEELRDRLGVAVSGVVMISPALDFGAFGVETALSPISWIAELPSMTAAHLEAQGKLNSRALVEVEEYARSEFAVDLLRGRSDPQAVERLATREAAYVGLDRQLIVSFAGRISPAIFIRESNRSKARIGSIMDGGFTAWDPFPESASEPRADAFEGVSAVSASAIVDFITRTVGWHGTGTYRIHDPAVGKAWEFDVPDDGSVAALRRLLAYDPQLQAMIAHGYTDLNCPYFASRLIVDQFPEYGARGRVRLPVYPGGHMFYTRVQSAQAFRDDARRMYLGVVPGQR